MLDIKFVRENPEKVKENIKKKFQDAKLPLVDEVLELDVKYRAALTEGNDLRAARNALSKQVGVLMGQAKKDPSKLEEAEKVKAQVKADADRLAELEKAAAEMSERIRSPSRTSSTTPFPSARTTAAMSRSSASASRSFPTSPSPTTPRLWRASTALTWMPPAVSPATAFTTSWETSPA